MFYVNKYKVGALILALGLCSNAAFAGGNSANNNTTSTLSETSGSTSPTSMSHEKSNS